MAALILIIDDSAMIRMQVKRTLTQSGYETVEAVDGQDAYEKLEAGLEPAVIVCDVNMPRMNGLEFLEKFSAMSGHHAPVVMLTTEGQPEFIRRARRLGAKGWLVKPFKPALLTSAVDKLTLAGV